MSEIQYPRWPCILHVTLCTTLHMEADSRVWGISSWYNSLILLTTMQHNRQYFWSHPACRSPQFSQLTALSGLLWSCCDLEWYFRRQGNLKTRLNSVTATKSHFLTFDWRWSCWKHVLSLSKLLSGHPPSLYDIIFSPAHTTTFCLRYTHSITNKMPPFAPYPCIYLHKATYPSHARTVLTTIYPQQKSPHHPTATQRFSFQAST